MVRRNPGNDVDQFGEALWRKLVEKKVLRNEEKKKPVFKVTRQIGFRGTCDCSVTRFSNFLHFGQLFKAFGNN